MSAFSFLSLLSGAFSFSNTLSNLSAGGGGGGGGGALSGGGGAMGGSGCVAAAIHSAHSTVTRSC